MNIDAVMSSDLVDFTGIPDSYFLLGLLTAFDNRFQAMADKTMREISWKQFFAIVCINLCIQPPAISELAEIMGSSHQNVKQILLKLEKKNLIEFQPDEKDGRKQRVLLTDACRIFCAENDRVSSVIMEEMFAGISCDQIRTTIGTILKIEDNMRKSEERRNEGTCHIQK